MVGDDGEQLGIMDTQVALNRAQDLGLDLVEVSPTARPPVCKIMDYGRYKYQQKRKANEAKKKQQQIEVKEVKFRPKTDTHDFDVKVNRVRRFIGVGNKCKITIMFRGREIVHPHIGEDILRRVYEATEEITAVESMPRMEGRQMFMILAPTRGPKKKQADPAPGGARPADPAPKADSAPSQAQATE